MNRKRIIELFILITIFITIWLNSNIFAAVYEASTLHNAVSRSETVQDLFSERWKLIEEQELYFDFYGKLNWVPGFKINTINKGTGEKEAVDMRLIRTYGSVTVNYPIIGGYEGKTIAERMRKGPGAKKKSEEGGLWKPKNLILGFTATGFHYGLTSETSVDRGDAGTESVTDYKYTQFFDDIFAASLLYRPYFFIHGGVIINNQIEPNDDGTMDYGNSTNRTTRYFVSSNLLSFLNLNAATTKDKVESIAVGLIINNGLKFFMKPPSLLPRLTVTYKKLALFNDEPYDPVWVVKSKGTAINLSDSEKDSADLHTLSLLIEWDLLSRIFIAGFAEYQKPSKTLIEKRTVTSDTDPGEEVEYAPIREMRASLGYNFLSAGKPSRAVLTFGLSRYWDVAIPVHRESGEGYTLTGGFLEFKWESPWYGIELKGAYNYSSELRKLVETADKFMIETSIFARF